MREEIRVAGSLGQSEHWAASRVRWDERQRLMATQEEEARRNVQEVDNDVNQNWTAVYQTIAKIMLKYLEDSEALKVSTRELEEHVLSPNEPSVDIARSEESKKAVPDFQQTRIERDPCRSYGEIEGAYENVDCVGEGTPGTQGRS